MRTKRSILKKKHLTASAASCKGLYEREPESSKHFSF